MSFHAGIAAMPMRKILKELQRAMSYYDIVAEHSFIASHVIVTTILPRHVISC